MTKMQIRRKIENVNAKIRRIKQKIEQCKVDLEKAIALCEVNNDAYNRSTVAMLNLDISNYNCELFMAESDKKDLQKELNKAIEYEKLLAEQYGGE